jgi:4-amino-4-deoxy-L-arabinose transferase-like glycosyltransferase
MSEARATADSRRVLRRGAGWLRYGTERPAPAPGPALLVLAWLTLGVGLGSSGRLTYHEAIVAQGAREMLAGGDWRVPTLGGIPWLEKPPLLHWAVAAIGWASGGVDEWVARLPSAVAATLLALGVSRLATRGFGPAVGRLAGLVQLTTSWAVVRGRLCESDMPLACLVTWAMVGFSRISREGAEGRGADGFARPDSGSFATASPRSSASLREAVPFFALLGATALAKGIVFGGVLVAATIACLLVWDRDRATALKLVHPLGWLLAGLIALAWPLEVLRIHPAAMDLWKLHVADRLASRSSHFAGEPPVGYLLSPLLQTLPWTPLALAGAWRSWGRAARERYGPDRPLWVWAIVPAVLVSLASVRNAHYLIYALPPWSVWAALGLVQWERRRPGVSALGRWAFVLGGVGCAVGFAWLGPRFDHRGAEWAWYSGVSRRLDPGEPLVLLHDDWDRLPYPTPNGPVPHDLAVRLFYLDRPGVTWHRGPETLVAPADSFAVIARERDLPALGRLGRVEELARSPAIRWDRAYSLYRIRRVPREHLITTVDPSAS